MNNALEDKIRKAINARADNEHWFSDDIAQDHFQLLELRNFFGDLQGKRILDIGCGRGRFVKALAQNGGEVVGVDLSDALIQTIHQPLPNTHFFVGSATELPFENESFDGVYAIETIEHVPNTSLAISEACRVLKPGGRIIIIDKRKWSFHPTYILPTVLVKIFLERTNRWFYDRNFGFTEIYFTQKMLDSELAKYCTKQYTANLKHFGLGPRSQKVSKRFHWLIQLKNSIIKVLYTIFPGTSFYIAWKWEK